MKKIFSLLLVFVMILSLSTIVPVMANEGISVKIDGQPVVFDVQPQLINDRTMVPLRAIFEALGATVDWNGDTQTVTSTKGNTTISLAINNPIMYVNGATIMLDSPACLIDGRTLVPVRAISEAFGTTVEWDGATSTVLISQPILFSGKGDKVFSAINIPAGNHVVEYTHDGSSNFVVTLHYGDGQYEWERITNEIGTISGIMALHDTRNKSIPNGFLEVEADGNWTICIRPVAGTTTTNIAGHGETVTGIFTATTANNVVTMTHNGSSNFVGTVYEYGGAQYDWDRLVNEIGNYNGQIVVKLEVGKKYYIAVSADGDWTIDFGKGDALSTYNAKDIAQKYVENKNSVSGNNSGKNTGVAENNDDQNILHVDMDQNSAVGRNVYLLKNAILNNGQKASSGYGFKQTINGAGVSLVYLPEKDACAFMMKSQTSDGTEVITTLYLFEDEVPAVTVSFDGEFIFVANYSQPSETINIVKSSGIDDTCIELVNTSYLGFDTFLDMISILYPDFNDFDLSDFGIEM